MKITFFAAEKHHSGTIRLRDYIYFDILDIIMKTLRRAVANARFVCTLSHVTFARNYGARGMSSRTIANKY